MSTPNFSQWLRDTGVIGPEVATWVLGRRTKRLVERYPPNTRFFSQSEYDRLTEQHRQLVRGEKLLAIAAKHRAAGAFNALVEAFEAGRRAR